MQNFGSEVKNSDDKDDDKQKKSRKKTWTTRLIH